MLIQGLYWSKCTTVLLFDLMRFVLLKLLFFWSSVSISELIHAASYGIIYLGCLSNRLDYEI